MNQQSIKKLLANRKLVEKFKACSDVEEIQNLAKENGLELTQEETIKALEFFKGNELQDEELNSVAGGGGTSPDVVIPNQPDDC
ncbi:MAG: Nif11-like leader peptide family RiPP precursor [Lachnospiraceae bacterium]|jgi:predicted ribosomally synthesized peptide with nif11-like leader|nr:Nif11-like leader peptide family RiPP precursor [Lachnospiraceae bacterium]